MELLENVLIDELMAEKIKSESLSMLDDLKLFLANLVASLFIDLKVYINPNQQDTLLPCLFVDFYSIHKRRKLNDTATYEVSFALSYVAENPLCKTELDNALFLLQQGITDIKEYPVQSVRGDMTDGIVNITGVMKIDTEEIKTNEFIKKVEQELNIK